MGYDYFSQMQGPSIPISLFADNYSKGVDAGNAVPSPVKAVVDGLTKGIQTGQQIVSNDQEIQLNQNKIDQLPVTNARQEEALQSDQQTNDLQAIQLSIAKDTEDLQLDATKAALTEKAAQLKSQTALRDQTLEFQKLYQQAATPELKKQLISSGQFNNVFANNPKLLQQSLAPIWGTLDANEKEAYSMGFAKRGAKDSVTAAIEKDLPAFTMAQNNWAESPLAKSLAVKTGINDSNKLAKKIEIVPSDYYKTDPTNPDKVLTDSRGRPGQPNYIRNPDVDPNSKTYDVVLDGKILEKGVLADEKKKYDTLKSKFPLHDGTVLQQKTSEAVAQVEKAKPKPATPAATTGQPSAEVQERIRSFEVPNPPDAQGNKTSTDGSPVPNSGSSTVQASGGVSYNIPQFTKEQAEVMGAFNLTDKDTEYLKEPINQLVKTARDYVNNSTARNSPALEMTKDFTIDVLSDQVAGIEFDKSPAIKLKYNQSKVNGFNASIDAQLGGLTNNPGISAALKVDSPKSLYVRDRKPAIALQFQNLYNRTLREEQKRANLVRTQPAAAQKTNAFLQSIKG